MAQHSSEVVVKWLDENVNPPDPDAFFDYFGGLRVAAIKTYDKNKLTAYRSFEYAKGYILSQPEYFSVSTDNVQKFVSQSWVPLLTTQSGYVGYPEVKETIHPVAIETGYSTLGSTTPEPREILRNYSWYLDQGYYVLPFPNAPFTFEWMAGNLQLEKVEDKNTTLHQYLQIERKEIEDIAGIALNREYRLARFSVANLSEMQACT